MIVCMDPIIMRGISLIPQQETYTPSVTPRCLPVRLSPCPLNCPPGSTISNKFNTMRRSLIYLSKLLSSLQYNMAQSDHLVKIWGAYEPYKEYGDFNSSCGNNIDIHRDRIFQPSMNLNRLQLHNFLCHYGKDRVMCDLCCLQRIFRREIPCLISLLDARAWNWRSKCAEYKIKSTSTWLIKRLGSAYTEAFRHPPKQPLIQTVYQMDINIVFKKKTQQLGNCKNSDLDLYSDHFQQSVSRHWIPKRHYN